MFVVPLMTVAKMSFSDWTLLGGDHGFNGLDNFNAVASEPLLWPSVRFTLLYTVIVAVLIPGLPLALALLVQESTRWNRLVRTSILIPGSLGLATASLLFWGLYSPNIGPIGKVLMSLGWVGQPPSFLGSPTAALWSTVVLIVWRFTGFYMLILMVGLHSIPGEVYEAARLDGARRMQTFRYVTLPLLRPSISISLILGITGSLLAFDQFYILTKGGPDNSTVTIVQLVYRAAFQRFDLGVAAVLAVIILVVLVLFNALQFRALREKD